MPPLPWPVPEQAGALYAGYREWLQRRGAGNHSFFVGAKNFLRRFPDPQAFAAQPLSARLAESGNVRPLLTYLMLHGHLRPGYDYLLERKLHSVVREAPASPIGPDVPGSSPPPSGSATRRGRVRAWPPRWPPGC